MHGIGHLIGFPEFDRPGILASQIDFDYTVAVLRQTEGLVRVDESMVGLVASACTKQKRLA